MAVHVMGIGAHPDDLEILCGGTLARYRKQGHDVTMCHIAAGDRGATAGNRTDLAAVRDGEARRAAESIGASCVSLNVPDGEVNSNDEHQKRSLTEAIRVARPDVVITHSAADYMADHNETSELASACSFLATLPLFETETPAYGPVPAVLFMDTLAGLDFTPTEYVDISVELDQKVEMMRLHPSQLEWLDGHDSTDMLEQIVAVARFRGIQCGVRHAEAFTASPRWLRLRPTRLLP